MKFTTYSFENNGDIFGMGENGKLTYVGRCDHDGDLRIESDYAELESEIDDCLKMTVKSALAGGIDWTPDACFLKAVGQ
jgi:hypothetical protein